MRAQSRSNLFSQDLEFLSKFEQISNKYSFDMILLNIEFLRKELQKVHIKMDALNTSLKDILTTEEYDKIMHRNGIFSKQKFQKHKTDLQEMKRRKWH